jgi:hypothetical protein
MLSEGIPSRSVEHRRPLRRQPNDHNFGSLIMLAVTAGARDPRQLLSFLEASEADRFVAHLYHPRRQYRRTCE